MAKPSKPDDGMALIAEILGSGSGRSPLYRWLRARHDAFAAELDGNRPDWSKLTEGFARLGILSPDGLPITPGTARHTWWRVRRDVANARAKRQRKAPPAVTIVAPPAPLPATPADPPQAMDGRRARLMAKVLERSGRKS